MPDPITLALLGLAGVGAAFASRTDDAGASSDATAIAPDATADTGGGSLDSSNLDQRMMNYNVEIWRPLVSSLAVLANQPVEFHMAWITVESGGNPCAVGSVHAFAPDGNPRELGLYQLYNPDELSIAGTSADSLRTCCAATQNSTSSQACTRALTSDEMTAQVQAGVNYIARRRSDADAILNEIGASWNEQDTWRLVKLYHALTGLVRAGLVGYKSVNGSAPDSWGSFAAFCSSQDLTPYGGANLAKYAPYTKVLANAAKVGGVVGAGGNV